MPCCFNFECDVYTAKTCPEDGYARALWAVYPPHWAVSELPAAVVAATGAGAGFDMVGTAGAGGKLVSADSSSQGHGVSDARLSSVSSTPICAYGKGPLAVHSAHANVVLVPFLASWVKDHGYDGIYLDQYFAKWTYKFPYPVDTVRPFPPPLFKLCL